MDIEPDHFFGCVIAAVIVMLGVLAAYHQSES